MSLEVHIHELHERHRQLEAEIEREMLSPASDDLTISELKKRKLRLKEEIERLEMDLTRAA
jgi:hypothetical protein